VAELAFPGLAAHADGVSANGPIDFWADDPADGTPDDVIDVGRAWSAPGWLRRPARWCRRVPYGARWAIAGVAAAGLLSYGVAARPGPTRAAQPAPATTSTDTFPTRMMPAGGTESHYPGLLQEYNDQRAARSRATTRDHPGHLLR
jgi:hypothetical protein